MAYPTLKKRAEFLAVRGGLRWSTPSVTVEARERRPPRSVLRGSPVASEASGGDARTGAEVHPAAPAEAGDGETGRQSAAPFRFGYTVTKKLGGAVQRNRIRRRLRAAVEEVAPGRCKPGYDYVLVARPVALDCEFAALKRDLAQAFERLHQPRRDERRPKPG